MTSTTVVEGSGVEDHGWGEARERTLTRRRTRIKIAMIATLVMVALATPLLRAWLDAMPGIGDRAPALTGAVAGALILLVAAVGGLIIWRRLDEVQRRRATNSWAMAGVVGYILYPVMRQATPLLGWAEAGHAIWLVMFVVALSAQLWQRWRD